MKKTTKRRATPKAKTVRKTTGTKAGGYNQTKKQRKDYLDSAFNHQKKKKKK